VNEGPVEGEQHAKDFSGFKDCIEVACVGIQKCVTAEGWFIEGRYVLSVTRFEM
jgi:hypothetical protein